jgi:hypothetical protein
MIEKWVLKKKVHKYSFVKFTSDLKKSKEEGERGGENKGWKKRE